MKGRGRDGKESKGGRVCALCVCVHCACAWCMCAWCMVHVCMVHGACVHGACVHGACVHGALCVLCALCVCVHCVHCERDGVESKGGRDWRRKGGGRRDELNQRGSKQPLEDALKSNFGRLFVDPAPQNFPCAFISFHSHPWVFSIAPKSVGIF